MLSGNSPLSLTPSLPPLSQPGSPACPPALPPASFLSPSALQVKEVGDKAAGRRGLVSICWRVSTSPGRHVSSSRHKGGTKGSVAQTAEAGDRVEVGPLLQVWVLLHPSPPISLATSPLLIPFPSHCSPHRSLPTGQRARPGGRHTELQHHTSRSESVLPLPGPPKMAPAPAQHRPCCGAAPVGRSRQQGLWA